MPKNSTNCPVSRSLPAASGQVASFLIVAHILRMILKLINQPAALAHIIGGFLLGPSALSRIEAVKTIILTQFSFHYYFEPLMKLCQAVFLFFLGLQMDVPYLMHERRPAATIAAAGVLTSFCSSLAITSISLQRLWPLEGLPKPSYLSFHLTSAGSAAFPLVACMASELKIASSDTGRLAMHAALATDAITLILSNFLKLFDRKATFWQIASFVIFVGGAIVLERRWASWLNKRNKDQKYIKTAHYMLLLAVTVLAADAANSNGFNPVVTSFALGLLFPRGGKSARTMLHRISSYAHIFILPIYFGFVGLNTDTRINGLYSHWGVMLLILVPCSIIGKSCGILAACRYRKMALSKAAIISLLLSLKMYIPFEVSPDKDSRGEFVLTAKNYSQLTCNLLAALVAIINVAFLSPVTTVMVFRDRSLAYAPVALEHQDSNEELRVLACVYDPSHVSTLIWLVGASSTVRKKPTVPYLVHLVELPPKVRTESKVLNSQQVDEDELPGGGEDDYGGDDVVKVNDALDSFVAQAGIMVKQMKAVAPLSSMYEEVCNRAEDARASIVLMPFHKHRRIDGGMESDGEATRTTNQRVLRHVQCTAGILVDRGLGGAPHVAQDPESVHVGMLFFGGADDREALAYSARICGHPKVNLTVIRFSPPETPPLRPAGDPRPEVEVATSLEEEMVAEISCEEQIRKGADDSAITVFYNSFVTSGKAAYVDKHVDNGAQTAAALKEMGDMYALFIVGKGGRGHMRIAMELSDWEECPELGTVGDLLASSDLAISASVLVIQQRKHWTQLS